MKKLNWSLVSCQLMLVMGLGSAQAAGLLKAKNGTEPTRIVSHAVSVTINNGFARTEVVQAFKNRGEADAEMIYAFPVQKDASLSELWLEVNGVERLGEVVEKERARKIYEDQKAQGNDTALAEQNGFKTFDIAVGRIPAGATVRVRMVYYQPIEIDLNVGRYLYPLQEGNTDDARIPFWSVDDRVDGPFRFELVLKSAFPIKDVRVPGFETTAVIENVANSSVADAETETSGTANGSVYRVVIESAEGSALDRDVVVYYRLDDTAPARVELIPYRASDAEPGTLMAVITPAADLQPLQDGRDWVFVLDVSGSMGGHKIATLADGVNRVLGKLTPHDRFRIVTFNNQAQDFTGGYIDATPQNVAAWLEGVKGLQANGGTALFAGLKEAYRELDADRTTGVILVTDGVCNVGPTQHTAFLELVRKYDLRLFTFVIGNSANQPLMEHLAKDTHGFALNISDADDIQGRLMQAKAKVLHQSFRDVRIQFKGERVSQVTPAAFGSLYAGQQAVVFGRYTGDGPVTLEMKARIGGEEKTWVCKVDLPKMDTANPELERLWALSRIEDRMVQIREHGEDKKWVSEVIDLGTAYSLVTEYTSMVVVKDDVFENEGIQRRNADRVQHEQKARQVKQTQAPVSRRVDQGQQTFQGRRAPGLDLGTGPVGPVFLLLAAWMQHRVRRSQRSVTSDQ